MKKRPSIFLATALILACGRLPAEENADIQPGDSVDHVKKVLGKPDGYLSTGDRALATYPRGKVEIQDGKVVDVDLVSQEEAERRAREEADRQRRQAEQLQEKREANRREGEKLKARKLNDPAFQNASARSQVAFWESFRKRYPDVPCDAEYQQALAKLQAEQEEEKLQKQIQDLEDRVESAEEEARRAREDAENAGEDAHHHVYSDVYVPVPVYPRPPVRPPVRPPQKPNRPDRPDKPVLRPPNRPKPPQRPRPPVRPRPPSGPSIQPIRQPRAR